MFSKFRKIMSKKEGVLAWNTLMLYILTFSTQLLSFIVVPYETRILGAAKYGMLDVAMKVTAYVQIMIDFGFILSATEEVSKHRNDPKRLGVIMTAVTLGKLGLSLVTLTILSILCLTVPAWQGRLPLYLTFFGGQALNALMPDYLYRGMEKMTAITVRTVLIRVFATVGIFLLLKPYGLWVIPILTAIGNFIAIGACFLDARKRLDVRFCRVQFRDVWTRFRQSAAFFFSRFASTAYSTLNTLILDFVAPQNIMLKGELIANPVRGQYGAASKLMDTGKQAMSPISDSLYPYMVKNHDYRLVKKVLLVLEPLIFAFCSGVFILAPWFCATLFGEEYRASGEVLRAMLPAAVVILPSYICGFPMLSSMGLAKHANYSTIFGSIIHVINLTALYCSGHMNMYTLGLAMSIAEILILGYRLVVIWRHRDRLKGDYHEQAS